MIHQWPHPVYSEMQSTSPQQPHNILMEGVTTDANILSGCCAWGHDQQLSPPIHNAPLRACPLCRRRDEVEAQWGRDSGLLEQPQVCVCPCSRRCRSLLLVCHQKGTLENSERE